MLLGEHLVEGFKHALDFLRVHGLVVRVNRLLVCEEVLQGAERGPSSTGWSKGLSGLVTEELGALLVDTDFVGGRLP